jgi:cytochrome c oxidase assembly protein subunit 11
MVTTRDSNSTSGVRATAAALGVVVASMTGLAFASEPLYRIFCNATGYGGTTQVALAPSLSKAAAAGMQSVTVRFDATVNSQLGWRFRPLQSQVKVKLGEEKLAFFEATNMSKEPIVGTATFNVSPPKSGAYFNKIQCFCFTEQVLRPGETAQMPVTFFVDPEMFKDENTLDVKTITLSYTFFKATDQSALKKLNTAQMHLPAPGLQADTSNGS